MTRPARSSSALDHAARHRVELAASPFPEGLSDSELVKRIHLGDAEAFEWLFHTYYEALCKYVLRYVESAAIAEELVQETFARVWERRTAWEVRGNVRSYLYGAARNRALTHLRHVRVVARSQDRVQHEGAFGGRAVAQSDEQVRMDDMAQALARAVESLPPRQRQAYTLRWQHELPVAEIAVLMGVSVKCIEAQLTSALKTIRRALAAFF